MKWQISGKLCRGSTVGNILANMLFGDWGEPCLPAATWRRISFFSIVNVGGMSECTVFVSVTSRFFVCFGMCRIRVQRFVGLSMVDAHLDSHGDISFNCCHICRSHVLSILSLSELKSIVVLCDALTCCIFCMCWDRVWCNVCLIANVHWSRC